MPKHEINHKAGQRIPSALKSSLDQYFKASDFEKLERLGGKIVFSLISPSNNHKHLKSSTPIEIDDKLVQNILNYKDDPKQLRVIIDNFSVMQLRKLGKLLNHPFRLKSTKNEIIEELIVNLHSEAVWNSIAHTKNHPNR